MPISDRQTRALTYDSAVYDPSDDGIVPVNWLPLTSSVHKPVNRPSDEGRVPFIWLFPSDRYRRLVSTVMPSGKVPEIPFPDTTNALFPTTDERNNATGHNTMPRSSHTKHDHTVHHDSSNSAGDSL